MFIFVGNIAAVFNRILNIVKPKYKQTATNIFFYFPEPFSDIYYVFSIKPYSTVYARKNSETWSGNSTKQHRLTVQIQATLVVYTVEL